MTIEALVARHAILNVLANHSRGVDRADANLLGSAYWPDATVDYGLFEGSAANMVRAMAIALKEAGPTLHRTCNTEIHFKDRQAVTESYVIAYVEDGATQRIVFGRYLDRLTCRDGTWKIIHRTYVLDGNTNRPNTVARGDPPILHDFYVPSGAKGSADPGRAILAQHEAASRTIQGVTPMPADAAALDAALSRDAIRSLITGYSRGMDRADKALLASVFWEDSSVVSGVVNAPGPEFAAGVVDYVTANLDYCVHSIANEWIEVKGDHGVGEHYIIAHMCTGGQDVMTGGRYIDSYERRDGVWKIKSRTFVADWNTSHPKSMELDGMYEPLKTRGSFGNGDPVYALWASL